MDRQFQSIYCIKEREFLKTKENVIKVGKTKQPLSKRTNQYPKGSELLFYIRVDDCDNLERVIIKAFKDKYLHRKDIGNEYFEGDYEDMIETICFLRKNFINLNNEENEERVKKIQQMIEIEIEKEEEKIKKELIKEEKLIQKEVNNIIELIIGGIEKNNKEEERLKIKQQKEKRKYSFEKFMNDFIITNNKTDYISSTEIQNYITKNELCINIKTLSVYIKEYCKNNNFNNIKNDCKRENGKMRQVWFGIAKVN